MSDTVSFAWKDSEVAGRFTTGVRLHGHTMHSEECLSFLPRYLKMAPGLSQVVARYESGPEAVNFSNAWWTPPLRPAAALRLERKQIEDAGLRPLVSLTDHDNIKAPLSLSDVPVSVEWTVPYERSIFHLGIHNLPAASAGEWMARLAAFTATSDELLLPGLLGELAGIPDCLIVLNHPFWLEEGITQADHDRALARILRDCIDWLHAFELNGTRTWNENRKVVELAAVYEKPLISGGDRHACEPAACINLTNAQTFSEFVVEVREGQSFVHFMPHYREPMALRIVEAAWDILRPYPNDAGRERWTDRIFYRGEDGVARTLSELWRERTPWIMTAPLSALTTFLRLIVVVATLQRKLRSSLDGLTPGGVAFILALGIVLGIFPVFGLPTLLCAVAAIVFRLNLAALQIVNQVCSPLQYLLLIPLARLGGGIIGVRASRNIVEHVVSGTTNAVVGWCLICLPLGILLYMILRASFHRRARPGV